MEPPDDIKRRKVIKQIQQYQELQDAQDAEEKKKTGEMPGGKKVEIIDKKNSTLKDIFNKNIKPD